MLNIHIHPVLRNSLSKDNVDLVFMMWFSKGSMRGRTA